MIDDYLTTFLESFPYTRVMRGSSELIYNIPWQLCDGVCKEANKLINEKNIPLVAISNSIGKPLSGTVIIKEKTNG